MEVNNKYVYKVCYTERHSKTIHIKFKTKTYEQAVDMKRFYYTYPQPNLQKPTWYIIPISRSEVRNGIWRENPF